MTDLSNSEIFLRALELVRTPLMNYIQIMMSPTQDMNMLFNQYKGKHVCIVFTIIHTLSI